MSNIQEYKKPQLIVLEEQPKIKSYSTEKKLELAKKIVINLLSDLGVSGNSNPQHHVRTIKFICESMINYSFGEIEKAFQMFIANKFREKPFQQLNAVIVGKVMHEYESYKTEKLKLYRHKQNLEKQMSEPTDQEKERIMLDAVDRVKKEIEETGEIKGSAHHVYDFLVESGRVKFTDQEKKAAFSIAKRAAIRDEKRKALGDYQLHKKLKETLSNIENKGNSIVILKAKTLLIENYFKK